MPLNHSILSENPMLSLHSLPDFEETRPEHGEPALHYILESNRKQIEGLPEQKVQPVRENFRVPPEEMSDWLDRILTA